MALRFLTSWNPSLSSDFEDSLFNMAAKNLKKYSDLHIHSVKKLAEIDAKLTPLSSIPAWSSSAICHLVCSQCLMLPVYLECVSRFFQWIRISNKEFVSNFALQMEFRVRNRWTTTAFTCYGSGRLFSFSKTQMIFSRHPFSVNRRHKREFVAKTEVDSGKCN